MAGASDLKKFLTAAAVPAAVVDYMVGNRPDGLGLESVSDYASMFKETDYEDKCQEVILNKIPEAKEDVVALARLRTAWQLARSELAKACKKRVEGTTDPDWDTPLPQDEEDRRKEEFHQAYDSLEFDMESTPWANIIGRYFREFRGAQRHASLTSLSKMRSEAEFKAIGTVKKRGLGDGVALTYDEAPRLPDLAFGSVMQVLMALKLLCNSWALAGANMVDSKLHFDDATKQYKRVRQCHLGDATSYYDFVFRKAMEHTGPENATIIWLLDRDKATRSKAKTLYSAGWPWGEALTQSREVHCAVLWTVSGVGVARGVSAVLPANVPTTEEDGAPWQKRGQKRRERDYQQSRSSGSQGPKAAGTCPRFNGKRGCTSKGRDCPEKKTHACDICGAWNHSAANHPVKAVKR